MAIKAFEGCLLLVGRWGNHQTPHRLKTRKWRKFCILPFRPRIWRSSGDLYFVRDFPFWRALGPHHGGVQGVLPRCLNTEIFQSYLTFLWWEDNSCKHKLECQLTPDDPHEASSPLQCCDLAFPADRSWKHFHCGKKIQMLRFPNSWIGNKLSSTNFVDSAGNWK